MYLVVCDSEVRGDGGSDTKFTLFMRSLSTTPLRLVLAKSVHGWFQTATESPEQLRPIRMSQKITRAKACKVAAMFSPEDNAHRVEHF